MRAEQEPIEKRLQDKQEMAYRMFQQLHCGLGQLDYEPDEYEPMEYELDEPVALPLGW